MNKTAPYPPSIKGLALAILIGGGMSVSQAFAGGKETQKIRLCEGESLELTASGKGASAFHWFRNGTPMPEGERGMVNITLSGIYEVMSVNDKECTSEVSDALQIEFLPPPNLRVTQPAVLCEGGGVDITQAIEGYDPVSFDYTVISPSGQNLKISDLTEVKESGIYQIQVNYKDFDCASALSKIQVEMSDEPIQALFDYKVKGMDAKGMVLADDEVLFESHSIGDNLRYEWDFGDGRRSQSANPRHTFAAPGKYMVQMTVTNEFGCSSLMEMEIEVNESYLIMIPTGFTPLAGENQTFKPKVRGISSYEMLIFNTWGDLLYEMNSMEDPGWDGKVKGKLGPNGNYVYKGTFTTDDGKKVTRSGVFTLIR